MRNIYQEVIDEGNEILEKGIGHLRRRTHMPVSPVKEYAPEQIKALREKNQYTQSYFGEVLGVSLKTVQAWEAGTNKPTGTALRIFQILEQDPHALDKYILMKA
ncbi:MAG: helix-turn-helix domain-containing protein [Defluviitaleaceae bacterium]|nr:helix-turn-helix domain-containing protein [Defluviitaleaceae bacterium]